VSTLLEKMFFDMFSDRILSPIRCCYRWWARKKHDSADSALCLVDEYK